MTPCFTKSYGAPEVLSRQAYDVSCDIWSLGCILYTMLVGITPFSITPNDSEQTILKKLNEGSIGFEGKSWNGISDEAKDLLRKMLSFDANSRPNAKQGTKIKVKPLTGFTNALKTFERFLRIFEVVLMIFHI